MNNILNTLIKNIKKIKENLFINKILNTFIKIVNDLDEKVFRNNILNNLEEIVSEKGYDEHPIKDHDFETKISYLHGLALVMNVDSEIHSEEKKYLKKLIKTFGINDLEMDNFINFALNPDKKIIDDLIDVINNSETALHFLVDCYEMAYRDKKIKKEEKTIIEHYKKILNVDVYKYNSLVQLLDSIHLEQFDIDNFNNKILKIHDLKYLFEDYCCECYIGLLYDSGKDYAKAMQWYNKAADKGGSDAMHNIALLYYNGQGVLQDYDKAMQWYVKAADKGLGDSMSNIAILYQNGLGVDQDYEKAMQWYKKAAAKGYAIAMFNIAMLYKNGMGVDQDYVKAEIWFKKAYKTTNNKDVKYECKKHLKN